MISPRNPSAPGNIGSGIRGSQWWPFATSTASYRSVSPVDSVTAKLPSGFGSTCVTPVPNRMRSPKPKCSRYAAK